jgi:hypothetical protein
MKDLFPFSILEKIENNDRKISMFYEIVRSNFEAYGFEIVKYCPYNDLHLSEIINNQKGFEFNIIIRKNNKEIRISFSTDNNWLVTINLSRFEKSIEEWKFFFGSNKIFLSELDKKLQKINSLI